MYTVSKCIYTVYAIHVYFADSLCLHVVYRMRLSIPKPPGNTLGILCLICAISICATFSGTLV